jgi:hypothetical protein
VREEEDGMEEEGTVRGPRCGDGRGGKAERVKEVKEDDRGCVGGGGNVWQTPNGDHQNEPTLEHTLEHMTEPPRRTL